MTWMLLGNDGSLLVELYAVTYPAWRCIHVAPSEGICQLTMYFKMILEHYSVYLDDGQAEENVYKISSKHKQNVWFCM